MNKVIFKKDYLHLYLGCEVQNSENNETYNYYLEAEHLDMFNCEKEKLILKPLSKMTGCEEDEMDTLVMEAEGSDLEYDAIRTTYLLKNSFDLFGLIEAGLAIDKTTIKKMEV